MIRDLLINQTNLQKQAIIDGETSITYQDLVQKAMAIQVCLQEPLGKYRNIFTGWE
uniref:hypothetical protein n=1 Tax=Clostridium sp. NkU-1 TaxID=1095009 RepID=UPI000A8E3D7C